MIIAATMAALYASNGLSGMPTVDYVGSKPLPSHKKKTGALKQKRKKKR